MLFNANMYRAEDEQILVREPSWGRKPSWA